MPPSETLLRFGAEALISPSSPSDPVAPSDLARRHDIPITPSRSVDATRQEPLGSRRASRTNQLLAVDWWVSVEQIRNVRHQARRTLVANHGPSRGLRTGRTDSGRLGNRSPVSQSRLLQPGAPRGRHGARESLPA